MKRLLTLVMALLLGSPVLAEPITMLDGFEVKAGKVGLTSDKVELRSSGGTGKATIKYADSSANARVYTWPDAGADAAPVMTAGAQTIAGVKTFSSPPTITGGLTAANIQSGSAKRQLLTWHFASNVADQTAADGTTYAAMLYPGRAGTVTRAGWGCQVAPIGGTSTLKILKAASNGNTMLSAATVDPTTLTDNTFTAATLTGTAADLAVTATQGIYVELVTGTQTTDAKDLSVTIEFEPTDF